MVSRCSRPNLLEVNTIPSLFINQISLDIDTRLKAPLVAGTQHPPPNGPTSSKQIPAIFSESAF